MAFSCGFFNSMDHDRRYNAEQFGSIFDGILRDGVYKGYLNEFKVEAYDSDNAITIDAGRAWFDHTWNYNDAKMILTCPPPDDTYDRVDAVVLETNHERPVRNNTLKIVTGVAGRNPTRPSMIRSEMVNQYPLAFIRRNTGEVKIEDGYIEMVVGGKECPYAQIIETMETKTGLDQYIRYEDGYLNFLADGLLLNGEPFEGGSGGGDGLEPVLLYSNDNYFGTHLPITLPIDDFSDFECIMIKWHLSVPQMHTIVGINGGEFTSVGIPYVDNQGKKSWRFTCQRFGSTNWITNPILPFAFVLNFAHIELGLSNDILNVFIPDRPSTSFAVGMYPKATSPIMGDGSKLTTYYDLAWPLDTENAQTNNYATLKDTYVSQGMSYETTTIANILNHFGISRVFGLRKRK